MHALIFLIYLHKSYSVATLKQSELLLLENHVSVVTLQFNLQRISIHSAKEFLHHSFTIVFLSIPALIKGS